MCGHVASQRALLLDDVARRIPDDLGRPVRLGVDGVDGAGKTTFADELTAVLTGTGRAVVRVSIDDFHHPRAVRYAAGRHSPEGFWLDSYDYARFAADVLAPLQPDGDRRIRRGAHDVVTDAAVEMPWETVDPDAILIVDGIFLHRDELVQWWDFSVFLDVPFAVSATRMATRDGSPADPDHDANRRYTQGQRIYLAACDPRVRASVVVDNSDVSAIVVSGLGARPPSA